jgi:glycosyltransferase involved in cell wall biosynthesis
MSPDRVFVTPLAASHHFRPVATPEVVTSTLKRYKIPHLPYILSLCTLEPRKNLSFLIRCFSQLIADDRTLNLNLVLVGASGWKNSEIFELAKGNAALRDRVIFTGYVPDEDLSAIYSGSLAFAYPSLYEGFGLPPLEAMQCGVPVITSNTSSLPEVVGDAGITIDPRSEDELCQTLLRVISDSQLRVDMRSRSLQQAAKFSWQKCAEETISVYKTAINSKD